MVIDIGNHFNCVARKVYSRVTCKLDKHKERDSITTTLKLAKLHVSTLGERLFIRFKIRHVCKRLNKVVGMCG